MKRFFELTAKDCLFLDAMTFKIHAHVCFFLSVPGMLPENVEGHFASWTSPWLGKDVG